MTKYSFCCNVKIKHFVHLWPVDQDSTRSHRKTTNIWTCVKQYQNALPLSACKDLSLKMNDTQSNFFFVTSFLFLWFFPFFVHASLWYHAIYTCKKDNIYFHKIHFHCNYKRLYLRMLSSHIFFSIIMLTYRYIDSSSPRVIVLLHSGKCSSQRTS